MIHTLTHARLLFSFINAQLTRSVFFFPENENAPNIQQFRANNLNITLGLEKIILILIGNIFC